MTISFDSHQLKAADAISSNNMIFANMYKNIITTQFKARDNNPVATHSGGGDQVMTDGGIVADGDIVLSVGWGNGFGVHRVLDNGSMTQVYHDNTPNNGYTHYTALAVDKARSIAYVGNFVYDNLAYYDYSNLKVGGTTVTKLGTLTEAADGLPSDEIGDYYMNGLAIAGDWLYFGPDDHWWSSMKRWNTQTKVAEDIPITNVRHSALQGQMQYSEATDRIYASWNANGEIWVICDASTSSPRGYNIRVESLGFGNDMHQGGIVEDKDNPNHIWFVGHRRIGKLDITNCITDPVASGTNPTLVGGSTEYLYDNRFFLNGHLRMAMGQHPEHKSDFLLLLADRGWLDCQGWYDQENNVPVAVSQRQGDFHASQDPLTLDYQPSPVLATSPNGTKYWVYSGYGWDGHSYHVYTYDKGYVLETSSEVVLGDYVLPNNENIEFAQIDNLIEYIPSGCGIQYYISNNAGSTWEPFANNGQVYRFASVGNKVRLKIIMNGTTLKAPHIQNTEPFIVAVFSDSNYKPAHKRLYKRLRGRRS